jgi:hypothetical protein
MTIQTSTDYESLYGYVKDGKVYLKSCLNNADRVIGEVKSTPKEAIEYFEKRFGLLEEKVNQMIAKMQQAENRGSFLMQTLHLKEQLNTFNALGDFEKLLAILNQAEIDIKNVIAENREKNLILKQQLLKEGFAILKLEDPREKVLRLKEFRTNWLQIGAVPDEQQADIEADYQEIMNHYHDLREAYHEVRSKQIEEAEAKFREIIRKASELVNKYDKESLAALEVINQIEEEWKKVTNIPKTIYAPLLNEFKDLKRKVLSNVKRYRKSISPRDPKRIFFPKYIPEHEAELYENLRNRLNLIEEAKSLNRIDIRTANERAKELQQRWKASGMIPEKFKSEVYHQFNLYCDRIFELSYLMRQVFAKNPYFKNLSRRDQLELKIEAMNEIIAKEEEEIAKVAKSFESMSSEEKNLPDNKIIFTRLNTSRRKLKAKARLLEELKEELNRILNSDRQRLQRNEGGSQQKSGGYQNKGGDERNRYGNDRARYDNRGGSSGYDRSSYGNDSGNNSYRRDDDRPYRPYNAQRREDDQDDYLKNSSIDRGY